MNFVNMKINCSIISLSQKFFAKHKIFTSWKRWQLVELYFAELQQLEQQVELAVFWEVRQLCSQVLPAVSLAVQLALHSLSPVYWPQVDSNSFRCARCLSCCIAVALDEELSGPFKRSSRVFVGVTRHRKLLLFLHQCWPIQFAEYFSILLRHLWRYFYLLDKHCSQEACHFSSRLLKEEDVECQVGN